MFEFFKTFFEIIIDGSNSIASRLKKIIFILILIFFVDNLFNISNDIYLSNKLNNLETINKLKQVYKNDITQYNNLIQYEQQLLNSQHYYEKLSNFLNFSVEKNSHYKKTYNKNTYTIIRKGSIGDVILMFLSSNICFIILFPSFLLLPFYTKEKKNKLFYSKWLFFCFLFLSWIFITTFLLTLIPVIFKNIVFNYVFNFIIHMTICTLIIISPNNKTKGMEL